MPTVRRTIVLIHPGGLGDVLLAVPAMARLRARFPHHRLVLCAEDQIARLLLACRIIDAWTSVQGRACAELFAGADQVTGQVQIWLEGCDLAIGWMQDLGGKLSETLKAVGVREVIVKSPFSTSIRATHQRDRFLEAINEAPFDDAEDVRLAPTELLHRLGRACLEAAGLSIGESLVVIHPGSGSAHKCVAPELLANVVGALQISGATPVILEGPADREPVERVLQSCVTPPTVLQGLDVRTVAGVLAQARLFVGQDSGVTHMAGLMGVRTVALFGPTNPARWAPRGTHVTVVQAAPCLCQSWGDVSRCEKKPCLEVSQEYLVALCLAPLKEVAVRQRTPSGCLVTDYPLC
ncbi:MAG: glycosyltransferase family 9 protein [Nitrospirota bacterium]|nr:glycosyltransferase family 9 protein [Nitrospirota bacterium]